MKSIITFLFLLPLASFAQDEYNQQPSRKTPITDVDMHSGKRLYGRDFDAGYQTISGWIIKEGDTLQLGRGTLPTRAFAFAYQNPGSMLATYSDGHVNKHYLPSQYAGNRLVIKSLGMIGAKRTGFSMVAVVGAGGLVRYQIEIENAIEAGEILPPPAFRKASAGAPVASVADELLKLKSLLDAGALTPEEYNSQKKKLLNQ